MFCGIGGFRLGLKQTNLAIGTPSQQRLGNIQRRCDALPQKSSSSFACVWANDNDKYACQIYRKHFGTEELVEGDIRTVEANSLPDFELLTAGFPCQTFSLAGKRQGIDESRGTLFTHILRIASAKRPKLLLLENVKGLLSNDSGRSFAVILRALDGLGYDVEWQVFNSKYFGVPQSRERVFIIGHLRGTGFKQIFPIGENGEEHSEEQFQRNETSSTLRSNYHKNPERGSYISHSVRSGGRASIDRHSWDVSLQIKRTHADGNHLIRAYEKECPTLTQQMGTGGNNVPMVANSVDTSRYLRQMGRHEEGKHGLTDYRIRRLTPTECERLQSFPDGWTTKGLTKDGKELEISDTQRYKLLGNAVTTNVVQFIGEQLLISEQTEVSFSA